MNAYKKLIGNSAVFAIGNLGSKVISLFLVPVYTYYLSQAEYGTIDLVTTTTSMLLPIVSSSMSEAILRFVMDKNEDKDTTLTNSLFIILIGYVVFIMTIPILIYLNVFNGYLHFLYLLLLVNMLQTLLAQYIRGIGKTFIFAVNGILLTFFMGALNIIFLVFLKLGVNGYFYSMILAYLTSIIFLFYHSKAFQIVKIRLVNVETMKRLVKYSFPLIPNTLMWWLINTSSRYFIRYFSGINANGLFAVSSRIPSLISLVSQIFAQAWQLSAIEEYQNDNQGDFYKTVFNYYQILMFTAVSVILILIKPVFFLVFSIEYFEAWKAVPFLLVGAIFSAFSGFLGQIYIASKQTKGVFRTSIYGGIVSVGLNILLIPSLGIIGAGISSMLSFMVMFLVRYNDARKLINFTLNWKKLILNIIIIFTQIIVMFLSLTKGNEVLILSALSLSLILTNKELFKLFNVILKTKTKGK